MIETENEMCESVRMMKKRKRRIGNGDDNCENEADEVMSKIAEYESVLKLLCKNERLRLPWVYMK